MKVPKTIQVAGKTYTVRTDPKAYGASGRTGPKQIRIGTAGTAEQVFDNLLHEAAECTMVERGYRYQDGDDHINRSRFVLDHNEFQIFCSDLASSLWCLVTR